MYAADYRVRARRLAARRVDATPLMPHSADISSLVPIVHADDCGLSPGITDAILACYDRGWLRRTSVIVNGAGWEYAVAELKQRPRLPVVLHLNIFEGRPVSPPSEVDLLVDARGQFYRGFAMLWARGLAGAGAGRLRGQIRLELRRQIERFQEGLASGGPLSVDGHVHYHIIPPVLGELLALCAEYPIRTIRLPREPLYWPLTRVPRPSAVNVLKNVVLRTLCRRALPALEARSIDTTAAFIGVLATGAMTLEHVRASLEYLRQTGASGTVEILFHPGRGRPQEAWLWKDRPDLEAYYLSPDRDREAELLRSDALGELLRFHHNFAEHGPSAVKPSEIRPPLD